MTNDKNSKNIINSNSEDLELGKLIGLVLDSKWLILLITIISITIGISYALLSTPFYQSDALIQVEKNSSGGFSSIVSENLTDMFSSESSTDAEIQIITSRMILSGTVKKFNLTTVITPNYFPIIGKGLARLTQTEQKIKVTEFDVPYGSEQKNYKLKIINTKKGSYKLLDEDSNKLLTGVVGHRVERNGFKIKVSDIKANDGFTFSIHKRDLMDTIDMLKLHMAVKEQGNQTGIIKLSYLSENKVLAEKILNDISRRYFLQNVERNSAEAEQSIQFLKEKLPQLKAKLINSENKLNAYRQKRESVDLTMEAESTLQVMVDLDSKLNELTFKEAEISQKYTKDHPAYKALLDKRRTLLKQKSLLNKKIERLPETQKEVLSLQRDVQVNQQIYIQLLNKVEELSVVKAGTVGNVRIIDHAKAFYQPVKPTKWFIVILSGLIGIILSAIVVLVKATLHKGVENPDDIEEIGLAVYASVPKSQLQKSLAEQFKRNKTLKNSVLLAETNPADLSIEALRSLRTTLHFAMLEAKNNVVMFSGPAPSIGKSFISTNFSAVYAKTGYKVLLIDADMRKGYLHQTLGISNNNGLSNYLSKTVEISDCIKSTNIDNLDIITRGDVPPNPSELLMNENFNTLISWANENYDLVIIDTPPILAVTDASIVGALAGTTLMVAMFGMSSVKELDVARGRFERSGIKVKGVILNAVEKTASSHYGYGYYNYSYE